MWKLEKKRQWEMELEQERVRQNRIKPNFNNMNTIGEIDSPDKPRNKSNSIHQGEFSKLQTFATPKKGTRGSNRYRSESISNDRDETKIKYPKKSKMHV